MDLLKFENEEIERKKFSRDALFSFLPPIIRTLSGLVAMIFITKYIGTTGYGIWAQFQATLSLGLTIACLNFGHSLVRFLAGEKTKDYIAKTFSSVLITILSLTLLIGIIFIIWRNDLSVVLFGNKDLGLIIVFLALLFVFQGLNRQIRALLRARRYIKFWALADSVGFISLAIFIALSAIITKSILIAISALVLVEIAVFTVFLIFIRERGIRLTKPDIGSIVPLFKFGAPLMIAVSGYWIVQTSDRYLIKYFLDISQVGIYSVGYSVAFVLLLFWTCLNVVLLPDLSALYDRGEKKELEIRFNRVLKYGLAISVPAVVVVSILSGPIVRILSSSEFIAASPVLIVVSVGMLFYGLLMHFANLLNVLKKVHILNLIWVIIATVNIGLNFLFIPKIGIMGAAYSTLISFLIGAIAIIAYSRFYFNIIIKKEWIIKIAVATIIMGGIVNSISVNSVLGLIIGVGIGTIIYTGAMILLRFYDKSELVLLKKLIGQNTHY